MKSKEYYQRLQKMVEKNPAILDLDVIAAGDDEGNGYVPVFFDPSVGVFDRGDNSFASGTEEDLDDWGYTKDDINAICLN